MSIQQVWSCRWSAQRVDSDSTAQQSLLLNACQVRHTGPFTLHSRDALPTTSKSCKLMLIWCYSHFAHSDVRGLCLCCDHLRTKGVCSQTSEQSAWTCDCLVLKKCELKDKVFLQNIQQLRLMPTWDQRNNEKHHSQKVWWKEPCLKCCEHLLCIKSVIKVFLCALGGG